MIPLDRTYSPYSFQPLNIVADPNLPQLDPELRSAAEQRGKQVLSDGVAAVHAAGRAAVAHLIVEHTWENVSHAVCAKANELDAAALVVANSGKNWVRWPACISGPPMLAALMQPLHSLRHSCILSAARARRCPRCAAWSPRAASAPASADLTRLRCRLPDEGDAGGLADQLLRSPRARAGHFRAAQGACGGAGARRARLEETARRLLACCIKNEEPKGAWTQIREQPSSAPGVV